MIEVQIIRFPQGLLGFPHCKRYALCPLTSGFAHLRTLDRTPALRWYMVDPGRIDPDYNVPLYPDHLKTLKLATGDPIEVFAIMNHTSGKRITANLMGPIVINATEGLGVQIVRHDKLYGSRTPINLTPG